MKIRLLLLLAMFGALAIPAAADDIYNNGPINGNVDAWLINFGNFVGDSFTVSGGSRTIDGLQFGAWLTPGDTLQSVQVWISSEPLGGTTYFDQQVNFTASGCVINQFAYDVCTETGTFHGFTLNAGTYWVVLQNAIVNNGDPVYWDENSGIGCTSPGCPSETVVPEGSIPSEAFTVLGAPATSTTPESSSIFLLAGGVLTLAGALKRNIIR